jgi:hypothetical protein
LTANHKILTNTNKKSQKSQNNIYAAIVINIINYVYCLSL